MNLALSPEVLASAASREILERLTQLHPKSMDLSLGRLLRLLGRLGEPQRQLPPVIHVAGTNGKGSAIAYMRAALEAAGYRVHVYISPHLLRFNERIRLAGREIADAELEAVLQDCERANAGQPITFFEITTAAALLAFARYPADFVLLETGLGGRLDATNVVDRPLLTAITPVSLDHQQFLGDTIAAIAGEKAGILKPGVRAVIGPQRASALKAIAERANALGAPLSLAGRDWQVSATADGLSYRANGRALSLPRPGLAGLHQIENAGLALACLHALEDDSLSPAVLATGLRQAHWPGRLQRLAGGALESLLPPGGELWLDGGHNPAAGEVLARTLADWQAGAPGPRPLHLIFGMLDSKDPGGFLAPFRGLAPQVRTVRVPGEAASLSARSAAAAAVAAGLRARPAAGVEAALAAIGAGAAGAPPRVLICGSLYLAGHVLGLNLQGTAATG